VPAKSLLIEPDLVAKKRVQKGKKKEKDVAEQIPAEGDFKFGDAPSKVLGAKMSTGGVIMVTIGWNPRSNGVIPKPSSFANTVIREVCPKLLVDFYESRINLKPKQATPAADLNQQEFTHQKVPNL